MLINSYNYAITCPSNVGAFGTKQTLSTDTDNTGSISLVNCYGASGASNGESGAFIAGFAESGSTFDVYFVDVSGFTMDVGNSQVIAGLVHHTTAESATNTAYYMCVGVGRFATNDSNYPNKFYVAYLSSSETIYYWNGSAWTTSWSSSVTFSCPTGGGGINVRITKDATNFTVDVTNHSDNTDIVTGTPQIAKSSVYASTGFIAWGERMNDYHDVNTATIESIEK
jgi:hypothetical protein